MINEARNTNKCHAQLLWMVRILRRTHLLLAAFPEQLFLESLDVSMISWWTIGCFSILLLNNLTRLKYLNLKESLLDRGKFAGWAFDVLLPLLDNALSAEEAKLEAILFSLLPPTCAATGWERCTYKEEMSNYLVSFKMSLFFVIITQQPLLFIQWQHQIASRQWSSLFQKHRNGILFNFIVSCFSSEWKQKKWDELQQASASRCYMHCYELRLFERYYPAASSEGEKS